MHEPCGRGSALPGEAWGSHNGLPARLEATEAFPLYLTHRVYKGLVSACTYIIQWIIQLGLSPASGSSYNSIQLSSLLSSASSSSSILVVIVVTIVIVIVVIVIVTIVVAVIVA